MDTTVAGDGGLGGLGESGLIEDTGERRYEVLHELGRGGMATVYLAERSGGGYRHKVALKIAHTGLAGKGDSLARFTAERQILANLEHPFIARIFDGGCTTRGQPYFAMELVDGEPIDLHCRKNDLSIEDRLRLFQGVCRAVHFAHRNLVVHRDLKPSNILVTRDGIPKLLDFGIAKLLDPEQSAVETAVGGHPLTLRYASPEQVRGDPLTTSSDVYSLGVVLYEILTGQLPYETGPLPKLVEAICDREPTSPSTAVRTGSGEAGDADTRATVDRLARQLRGDLDHIVLRALRKAPSERYASAEQLAEDLQRFLDGEPVIARPATLGYRVTKFLGRHLAAVIAATLGILVVVAFAVAMAVQSSRIAAERDRAELERDRAEEVSDFLVRLFEVSDPTDERSATVTAREILDAGAQRIANELPNQPALRASLMVTMGRVYNNLGVTSRARELLEAAARLNRQTLGDDDPAVARSLGQLGWFLYGSGAVEEAEPVLREALDLARRAYGEDHLEVAKVLNSFAAVRLAQGEVDEAETVFRQVLDLRRRQLGDDSREVAQTLNNLGLLLHGKGELAEAEESYRQALESSRRALGERHPDVLTMADNLGLLQLDLGKTAEAEARLRDVLAKRREVFGEDHPEVVQSLNNVAWALFQQRKLVESEDYYRQALAILESRSDVHPGHLATILINLGWVLEEQVRPGDAVEPYRRSLAVYREVHDPGHPNLGFALESLGGALLATGELDEGEAMLEEGLGFLRASYAAEHPDLSAALLGMAEARLLRGDPESALPYVDEAAELLAGIKPEGHWQIAEADVMKGRCLAALGRFGEAGEKLRRGQASYRRFGGDDDPRAKQVEAYLSSLPGDAP